MRENAGDIFPEYFVLRVNEFNDHAVTPLDEWVRFLKSGVIDESTQVQGLQAARERLRVADMTDSERAAYNRHIENLRIQWDVLTTAHGEGWDEGKEEGREEGRKEGKAEGLAEGLAEGRTEGRTEGIIITARNMIAKGIALDIISQCTGLTINEIERLK